jgi:hypothetical protein
MGAIRWVLFAVLTLVAGLCFGAASQSAPHSVGVAVREPWLGPADRLMTHERPAGTPEPIEDVEEPKLFELSWAPKQEQAPAPAPAAVAIPLAPDETTMASRQ